MGAGTAESTQVVLESGLKREEERRKSVFRDDQNEKTWFENFPAAQAETQRTHVLVPVQLARLDPFNFKEPVGDFPGCEVHLPPSITRLRSPVCFFLLKSASVFHITSRF
jgi:hypothetical protein